MKKVRKFAQGGSNPNISDDVRQRAKFFAALADKPEAQQEFARSVREAQQAEAEASDRAKLPPPSRPAPAQRPTPSGGSGSASAPAPTSSGRDRSMGARTSRPTPQAYSSDDFDPNEAPADAAAAFRRSDQFSPDFAPAEAAASLNARTRNMGVEEPKLTRTPTRVLPVSSFEEENAKRVAKNKSAKQEREESEAAAKRSMDDALEEAKTRGTSTPRSKNVSAMGERQARQMEDKGSVFSKDFGKPPSERDRPNYPTAERLRAEERRQMAGESARDREDMDTGIAKSKSRSEAEAKRKQEERDRRESERKREIRRAEVEGNVERDEASQGAARRKQEEETKRRDAERKRAATSKAMQARQEREEEDTGIAMRKTLLDTERREARQNRPNYPTERRVIDERRKRILGTDRPSMFKRKRDEDEPRTRNASNPQNFKSGGMVSSASKRADGIASKGKTRGRIY